MANYARSESEITSFDKNRVFGSQYIILWNENTQTDWTRFNISEFGIFSYYFYIVCHTTRIDDQIECPKTKSNILFIRMIIQYSTIIMNTKFEWTIKVDQFWRNVEWNIFIWKNTIFLQWIQVFLESHYTITVIWIFTYIQIWVLTYLKTDGFIFFTFHDSHFMTIFATSKFCSRNCICFV